MTELVCHDGACDCGQLRYRVQGQPIIVHCCHCRWCQRETGSAFALNAVWEFDRVQVQGEVEEIDTPSASGKGQIIARCPRCKLALWSYYSGSGRATAFVRVGTLTNPDLFAPDVHIFTSSKQPWVMLSDTTPAFAEFYDAKTFWSTETLTRWKAAKQRYVEKTA